MVKFNIIGIGFLDVSDPSGVAFKTDNHLYRFSDISLSRSTEFSVPATERNRKLLQFGEDPVENGIMLRRNFKAQMVYDGGCVDGTLAVTSYDGGAFRCVFEMHYNERLEQMMGKKLADMALGHDVMIGWDAGNIAAADTSQEVQIVMYNRDGGFATVPPVPAVNIKKLIGNLLNPIGYGHGYAAGLENYWLVAGSMKGGNTDSVTLTQTDYANFTFSQVEDYVEIADIVLEWATANVFGALVGGSSVNAKAFRAKKALKMTFPSSVPSGTYLIRHNSRLNRCETLAGHPARVGMAELEGGTVDIPKGAEFFLASKTTESISAYYGWKDTDILSIAVTVEVDRNEDLAVGETWRLSCNLPDMTFFELLKAVALATGNDLTVDDHDIFIGESVYGPATAVALNDVVSVDKAARWVDAWGSGTRKAVVAFDSEDYVADPLRTEYDVQNEQATSDKAVKIAFSEGGQGTDGVQINDIDFTASPAKFSAKKWTIAYAEDGFKFLQRVEQPSMISYDDIAANSTCIAVKVSAPLSYFIGLSNLLDHGGFHRLFLWRGVSYVWTAATWSDRVMTLTLQKVSQPAVEVAPPPAVVSIKAQFNQGGVVVGTDNIDTLKQYLTVEAIYSDSTTRVLDASEYTLSGTLAYPSATVTVDCQGVTDTFTVSVAYDAQVAYLESTGTQYINTGVAASTTASYEVECSFETSANQFMCAIRHSGSYYNRSFFGIYNGDISLYYGRSSSNSWSPQTHDTAFHNYKQIVDDSSATVEFDGVQHSFTRQNYSLGVTYYLFRRNSNEANLQQYCSSKVRFAKFYDSSGSLVLNLIPVRCGTVGYMYDRVSGTLLGNDGTGDFVVGADV